MSKLSLSGCGQRVDLGRAMFCDWSNRRSGSAMSARLGEVLGDLRREEARALGGPHEVGRRRRGHLLVRTRSANWSQILAGSASSSSCSASRLIVRSRSRRSYSMSELQVADAVVERELPARRALLELVGAGLGPGQLGDERLELVRVLAARPARRASRRRAARRRRARPGTWSGGRGRRTRRRRGAAGSRPARRNPDSSISAVSWVSRRVQPQRRGDGEHVGPDPRGVEVGPVQLHDPAPVRVQVGLGDHAGDVGAQLHRRARGTPARARCTPGRRRRPAARRPRWAAPTSSPRRAPSPARRRPGCRRAPARLRGSARQPDLGVGELALLPGLPASET